MSDVVSHRRRPQRVRPPQNCRIEYLRILGEVEEHMDGTITVTPRTRQMELMLEGVLSWWNRPARRHSA